MMSAIVAWTLQEQGMSNEDIANTMDGIRTTFKAVNSNELDLSAVRDNLEADGINLSINMED